jgi:hypothetical protein
VRELDAEPAEGLADERVELRRLAAVEEPRERAQLAVLQEVADIGQDGAEQGRGAELDEDVAVRDRLAEMRAEHLPNRGAGEVGVSIGGVLVDSDDVPVRLMPVSNSMPPRSS